MKPSHPVLLTCVLFGAGSQAALLSAQDTPWLNFEDPETGEVCSLVNGADSEFVVLSDTGELVVVSAVDSVVVGSFVDDDGTVFLDDFAVGFIEFAEDADNLPSLWWLSDRGFLMDLNQFGDAVETDLLPVDFGNVACDACEFWDIDADCIDSDGDGVVDLLDLCPGTPLNEAADFDGCSLCQLDEDVDDVPDCEDVCPGSPLDEAVDFDGCTCSQLDSDLDGVDDCEDFCPDTPIDEAVDFDGCSCFDFDSDDDGVDDCDDLCPNTPRGVAVDFDGCTLTGGGGGGGGGVVLCGAGGLMALVMSFAGVLGMRRRIRR